MVGFTSGPEVPKQTDASTMSTVPRLTIVFGSPVPGVVVVVVAVLVIAGLPSRQQELHGPHARRSGADVD